MKRSEVYGPGKFMKANENGRIDIEGTPRTFRGTIKSLFTHTFEATAEKEARSQRVIVWEDEDAPALGLAPSNWDIIANFTGSDDDDTWPGTEIEVWVVPNPSGFGGKKWRLSVRQPEDAAPAKPAAKVTTAPAKSAPAKPAAAAPAGTFSQAWEDGVNKRLTAAKRDMDALRAEIHKYLPDAEIDGDVTTWTRTPDLEKHLQSALAALEAGDDCPF